MKSRFRITKDKVDDEFLYLSPNVFTPTPLNFLLSKLPARRFIIANSIAQLYNQSSFLGYGMQRVFTLFHLSQNLHCSE